jgi:cell division protein ZapA
MPEVEIRIGDRSFLVACEPGEERHLTNAAELLDQEASALRQSVGRVPEARMLLMAGLMLADKTIGMGWQIEELKDRIKSLEQRLEVADKRNAELVSSRKAAAAPAAPADPGPALQLLDLVATEMENLASELEGRAA